MFSTSYANGFGTLYTAAYHCEDGTLELRWPTHTWRLSLDAPAEGTHTEVLAEGSVA